MMRGEAEKALGSETLVEQDLFMCGHSLKTLDGLGY